MRIALAQMRMDADEQANLVKSLSLLEDAKKQGAELIFYPEVQLTPFFAQFPGNIGGCCGGKTGPRALTKDDNAFRMFEEFCRKYEIMASPNFYYRENGHAYDTSFLLNKSGDIIGEQKMVHIAEAPQFYEQDYYTPSDDGFHVFHVENGDDGEKRNLGIVVCFDRHYPESIRTEAVRGAELILIPTANTKAEPMELFEQEIRVQAFQNCCYIAMCNRVGKEAGMEFAGESLVADPDGKIIAKAGADEELLIADADFEKVRKIRSTRPYLNLRRPEFYA